MKLKNILLFLSFTIAFGTTSAQSWHKIITIEDLCTTYPGTMKSMLEEYNLNYPGFEKVKEAYDNNDIELACKSLLDYYKKSKNAMHLRVELPEISNKRVARADTILKNVFVIQNVRGQVPFGDDGHRDWYYKGPNNDREWAWLSNRHSQISRVFNVGKSKEK